MSVRVAISVPETNAARLPVSAVSTRTSRRACRPVPVVEIAIHVPSLTDGAAKVRAGVAIAAPPSAGGRVRGTSIYSTVNGAAERGKSVGVAVSIRATGPARKAAATSPTLSPRSLRVEKPANRTAGDRGARDCDARDETPPTSATGKGISG